MTASLYRTTEHKDKFLQHINSIHKANKFTMNYTRPDGTMSSMDIIITSMPEGTFQRIYRKPIYTYQHVQSASSQSSSIQCLHYTELQHLGKAVTYYKYPIWAPNRLHNKNQNQTSAPQTTRKHRTSKQI